MRAFVLVALLGCGGSQKATPKVATCGDVADAMIGMMLQDKEPPKATIDGFKTIIRNRCEQDAWTADARQCLATMKSASDAERCSNLLTEEQQAKLVADEKAKFGAKPEADEAAPMNAPAESPKRAKGAGPKKPGDPCDGSE